MEGNLDVDGVFVIVSDDGNIPLTLSDIYSDIHC